ncbi:MAG: tRNA epoxyqueuosine(34) reductase QueG [Candidatus Binatia bacterium]|nr:tRNA epoxyqueuosine(34) reductase QueG [Candidatus Binatia bacterium]
MSWRVEGETIRLLAKEVGFPVCRIAEASHAPHAGAFEAWLERGAHAGMSYLERTRIQRINPQEVMQGARSVIVLGWPYKLGFGGLPTWREELRGRIAAYALGPDYHAVLQSRLQALCAKIHSRWPEAACYASVDSGPVLERDWGWASGLGWFGKNTNILHRDFGSALFLAVILTDLEIEPDLPSVARCGRCIRCLPACPTGALDEQYHLDSRLCISYWTIEHRGPIPRVMRSKLGEWVFGCDVCQDVCPWNQKRARVDGVASLRDLYPFLPDLLLLSDDSFRARYRHTALWRAKREGIARNAAIVLGNSRNPDAIPFLRRSLAHDPSPVVRAHAAWALGQIGTDPALDCLRSFCSRETAPEVLDEIKVALLGSDSDDGSGSQGRC